MKKLFLSLCAIVMCTSVFAGNPLKVLTRNGDLKDIMKKEVPAVLVIDWTSTKFDNKKAASKEFGKDWAFIKKDCTDKFIEGFNKKSKGLKLQKSAKGAKYKFTIKVTNIDSFAKVFGGGGQTVGKVWGTLKIQELPKGRVVAEVEITEAEDGRDYVRRESFGKTMKLLGVRVAKLK